MDKIQKALDEFIDAVECDYGNIDNPKRLYEDDMRDYSLSKDVIDKLIILYETVKEN